MVAHRFALACYAAVAVLLGGFGATYLHRTEFMPYHADAVGKRWSDLPPGYQALTRALMKGFGGTSVVLASALLVVLLGPFRRGAVWAVLAVPALLLAESAVTLQAMNVVARGTPASEPTWTAKLGGLLTIAAFGLSARGVSHRGRRSQGRTEHTQKEFGYGDL
jgi:hypothetical protein